MSMAASSTRRTTSSWWTSWKSWCAPSWPSARPLPEMDTSILAFTLAALLLTLSPGPDTFLVIGSTVHGGIRAGLAAVAGIISGGFFHAALFALGVARLLMYSPTLFLIVKIAGALYLIWLGIGALRSAATPRPDVSAETVPVPSNGLLRRRYLQGLLSNALNPKIAVFYLAFLPQFLQPGDPVALKSAGLIGIHYLLGLVWLSILALAVGRFGHWLRRSRVQRALDGLVGAVMTGFGVRLALASR
ncbi:MAG: LysE family translocator [Nevskiaceae bacterium]|nr:MAG: LysE family translocator [Nevskiaceae bacterium]